MSNQHTDHLVDPTSAATSACWTAQLKLDLSIEFEPTKRIVGKNVVTAAWNAKNASDVKLVLDTRDLDITSVSDDETGEPIGYSLGTYDKVFGAALTVSVPAAKWPLGQMDVRIEYVAVEATCTAGQWLSSEQTVGKTAVITPKRAISSPSHSFALFAALLLHTMPGNPRTILAAMPRHSRRQDTVQGNHSCARSFDSGHVCRTRNAPTRPRCL